MTMSLSAAEAASCLESLWVEMEKAQKNGILEGASVKKNNKNQLKLRYNQKRRSLRI